ncbi:uncharacterized protein CMU_039830 [Cryptosporidium muris RN66]|uniref:Peptidase M60 domain-containing protein n=1 Tax=Cryptosporidium muris (strain RN66) TaxID=441375 RepID=B6A9M3_CRYMR|nr:uncharacterized protein CMU_039830 [Cryptosporidium muris RN66]EEA04914.1 hypothetical protein, conserved [Cryptosporidium muris RN66]|eukprot:XP_002139263.1 hypothetical protein [Cryptosporidium muris RN66]
MEITPQVWIICTHPDPNFTTRVTLDVRELFGNKTYKKCRIYTSICVDDNLIEAALGSSNTKALTNIGLSPELWKLVIGKYLEINSGGEYTLVFEAQSINTRFLKLTINDKKYHIVKVNMEQEDLYNLYVCKHLYNIQKTLNNLLEDIPIIGTPGRVNCFGNNTFGLWGCSDSLEYSFGWLAGCSLVGKGFVFGISHEGYLLDISGTICLSRVLSNIFDLICYSYKGPSEVRFGFLGIRKIDAMNFMKNININRVLLGNIVEVSENINMESVNRMIHDKKPNIIVWNAIEPLRFEGNIDHCAEEFKKFVYGGGVLIVAMCPWGWEQLSDLIISNSLANTVISEFGLMFSSRYLSYESGSNKITISLNSDKTHYLNTYRSWTQAILNPDKITRIDVEHMSNDINMLLYKKHKTNAEQEVTKLIMNVIDNYNYDLFKAPFDTNDPKVLLLLALASSRLNENTLSNFHEYNLLNLISKMDYWIEKTIPWNFENKIICEKSYCLPILISNGWQTLGLYIIPNKTLELFFFKDKIINKYFNEDVIIHSKSNYVTIRVQIGCHTDILRTDSDSSPLQRLPIIVKSYIWKIDLNNSRNNISIKSPYGGLLYFELMDRWVKDKFQSNILGYVYTNSSESCETAPFFVSSKINKDVEFPQVNLGETGQIICTSSINEWKDIINTKSAPWGELHGLRVIITLPLSTLKFIENPQEIVDFWDNVIQIQDELLNEGLNDRKERIVCDIQISDGYMHSGYPIMTHMDMCQRHGKLVNIPEIMIEGDWGLYHEIGHNRQKPQWTFAGTEEVTVNIFTLYTFNKLHAYLKPFQIDFINDQKSKVLEYLGSVKDGNFPSGELFNSIWKADPGIALYTYLVIIIYYGWNSIKKVFELYDQCELPETIQDQDKIQIWILLLSLTTNCDLRPYFKQWDWEINTSFVCNLGALLRVLYSRYKSVCVVHYNISCDLFSNFLDELNPWQIDVMEMLKDLMS